MGTELVISIGKIQAQERSPYYLYSIALYYVRSRVSLAGSGNTSPSWWYGMRITIESKLTTLLQLADGEDPGDSAGALTVAARMVIS